MEESSYYSTIGALNKSWHWKFCNQPPSNHHPTHGISSHRRHLVTSGFSEMEATCKARPPKKFWRSKSLGPCTVRVRGCWLVRWSWVLVDKVWFLGGLEGLAELQNPWIILWSAWKRWKTVGSLTYHLKSSEAITSVQRSTKGANAATHFQSLSQWWVH